MEDKVQAVVDMLRDVPRGANEAPMCYAAAQMLEQMCGSLRAIASHSADVTGAPSMRRIAETGLSNVGAPLSGRRGA